MQSLRPFSLAAIFAYCILVVGLASAQSDPVAKPYWSSALRGNQRQIAEAVAQPIPSGQKAKTHFAGAVTYDSGGPVATSVAVADLNGDGVPDLVVANYCQGLDPDGDCAGYGEVAVLLGNGDGTLQPGVTYSTGAYYAYSVAIGDVNGNGIPDLVVANWCQSLNQNGDCTGDGEVSVLLGNGDGTFQPAVTYDSGGFYATSVAIGDLNGDGKLDLAVTNAGENGGNIGSVSVLLGNGDGTFQSAVSYSTVGFVALWVAIGDLNGDGIPDLVVANFCRSHSCGDYNGEAGVLLGNGDGTFQPVVLYNLNGEYSYSVAVGDLRGDGILDLAVASRYNDEEGASLHNAVDVLLGNGDGTFQSPVSYLLPGAGYDSVAIGDMNGDGIPDLVVVEGCQHLSDRSGCTGTGKVSVLLGNGDGTFQTPVEYGSGGFEGSSVAIKDANGDGRPDLLVTNVAVSKDNYNNGTVAVLLNETYYASKTGLTSSPNPSLVNRTVTFTATITSNPPVPNGEIVTFYNGKTEIGTGTTTNGVATLTTSFSRAKTYTIKAKYPGDAFRKPSSGTVKQVVKQ